MSGYLNYYESGYQNVIYTKFKSGFFVVTYRSIVVGNISDSLGIGSLKKKCKYYGKSDIGAGVLKVELV